jgi:SAM-dependent methyltransferase
VIEISNAKGNFVHRKNCRICGSTKLDKFLSLGPTPLANNFLKADQLNKEELYYPLDVYFCNKCDLIQLLDIVPPEVMFKDYAYITGASKPMELHFASLAKDIVNNFKINKDSLVVDIGSNDGTLLQYFSKMGLRILGIEPASNIAQIARKRGIATINKFFSKDCAIKIYKKYGFADIIFATNVFAHVDNLENILYGIDYLLSKEGVFVIEVPYLINLLDNIEFDTIYHEHLSYFSIYPLVYLFRKFGMKIVDIKQISIHGGSVRIFVKRSTKKQSQNVSKFLLIEQNAEIDSLKTYTKFAKKVALVKERLVKLLKTLKNEKTRITGYGAAAKGNTLLNYCKIGPDILDYISDTTPYKQGRCTPGMHIPIFSEEKFHREPPNYVLLLAWNYADEILQKEQKYRQKGGKFILPLPIPKII